MYRDNLIFYDIKTSEINKLAYDAYLLDVNDYNKKHKYNASVLCSYMSLSSFINTPILLEKFKSPIIIKNRLDKINKILKNI